MSTPIEQVSDQCLLVVTVEEQLKWQIHMHSICKIVSRNIFLLSKLNQIISNKAELAFFSAHIMSHIHYVSNVWDSCANVHMKRLGSVYKRAINLMLPNQNIAYKEKCSALQVLPLDEHLLFNKCVLVQKVVHSTVP